EEDCDVALFLGYHAKFGTAKSTWDHTYSGRSIHEFAINGVPMSEFLLNSYAAGFYNVPVILVAGDAQLLKDDVEQNTPWAESVVFKQSLSRVSAKSPSMIKIEADLRESIKKSVINFKENKVQPLRTEEPVKASISFTASQYADIAELLPIVERTDGLTVGFQAKNVIDAYKIFQVLVYASSGVAGLLEWLQ
ncbi:MAG: M55 family metallopeptidase, partial [Promethearchaeota archaeon]